MPTSKKTEQKSKKSKIVPFFAGEAVGKPTKVKTGLRAGRGEAEQKGIGSLSSAQD